MTHFIDRRLNPKDKSIGDRHRFVKRVRSHVKKQVDEAVRKQNIEDIGSDGTVTVPTDGISEPDFHHANKGGHREGVLPGNKEFSRGDKLKKPKGGKGKGGKEGSPDGEGEDNFAFVLTRKEFLDIYFEDLELPNMVKQVLGDVSVTKPRRAGFSVTGTPGNLNVERTMRNALGRRIALGRPSKAETVGLEERIKELEAIHEPTSEEIKELHTLREELARLSMRQRLLPWLDPIDVRYRHYDQEPKPAAKAVMFCLMDVSASMGQHEKDLAKRFFVLLHLFLTHRYDRVDLVFIRHTHQAKEVDEETFFYSKESGGTVVSTALEEMSRVIAARYPASEWNIYAAQASDGENFSGDSQKCVDILHEDLMMVCQYFAYIEIIDENETAFLTDSTKGAELWSSYREVFEVWPNFAMERIAGPADIYPVFRKLFTPERQIISV